MNLPPDPRTKSTSSLFASFLAVSLVVGVTAILGMLMGGLVAVVLVLAGVIGLQYLIWGWWLGPVLRKEMEGEDQPLD